MSRPEELFCDTAMSSRVSLLVQPTVLLRRFCSQPENCNAGDQRSERAIFSTCIHSRPDSLGSFLAFSRQACRGLIPT